MSLGKNRTKINILGGIFFESKFDRFGIHPEIDFKSRTLMSKSLVALTAIVSARKRPSI